ncbi:hypothetical protein COU49_00720 [Candidatus Nomurabacteria bacterium CG10_big_fil_rev_8_21_14_0_10_35_16]|uniref:Peptidoglycan binding-like domain-containing protein n=1 Tax=Candidatus Nomurabacteria bacterium CG10_big_fil_rev_8_21_14_0_10_35_16 TaxID=1974731 RepID=A0A2H0TC25_9BACT|nr:MAG: hypothetical protein COU49_00720 [Candidatus Nomurabacteria bacterium CG10_big_fil_rev_8_21_14_0_10_35_16]
MSKLLKLKSAKFAIVLMLGLALVVPAGASAALTTAQVDAILGLLNSFGADATTVANVQASLTGGTPSTPGSTLDFGTATLRVGSSGQYVQNLQMLVGASPDGAFGPLTKAKVMAWQSANGLVADGIFGPASRAKAMGGTTYVPGTTPTTPVVNPTGPVTAMLATDNPAARSVVVAEAGADLAHFLFTGSGTVTNVTLQRIGVSSDNTLANVYLYDGAVRLTDAASVSSGSKINFNDPNGLFVVNGSKIISVRADLGVATTGALAGETVGITLVGYTALGQTAVTLGTPMAGNYMTVSTATLAGVEFGTVTPAANSNLTPDNDITVWQSTAAVTTRDVFLSRFTIREVGSINKTDISNLRLMVGANTVATVANLDANGYATFVPTSPLKLITGSHTFKVVADVTGGSSLSFTFSIRNKTDIGLIDSQYNVGLMVTDTVADLTGFLQTISTGYVTVQKATDSPTSTVVLSGTDVVLARYTAKTYGENVKVDTLTVDATLSTAGTPTLRNGRILIDGQQVGSTSTIDPAADTTATNAGTAFNVNHTFLAGTTAIIEVRADVYNNASSGTAMAAGDTILISLYGAETLNNAQGKVSGTATLDVPGAVVNANTLTVGSGSMTLAKDQAYGNQSVVVPTTGTLLGSFVLNSGTTEALNLDTITVDFTEGGDFGVADLTNVYVMYGSKSTSSKSTVSVTANANTWNISESMAVNTSMTFKVYGDIATGAVVSAGGDSIIASLKVSGTSTSGTAVNTGSVLAGQTISAVSTGVLTVSLDTNSPVAAQVVAGTTDSAGALKVKLTGTNEVQYVKSLTVYVDTNSDSAAVASMNLAWATTSNGTYATVGQDQSVTYTVSTYPGYATWNLTGAGRVTVPKDGSVYLKVTPTYVSSGQTEVSGKTVQLFLGDLQAEGTAVLSASSATPNLINDTGIVVQANSSATYVDSVENMTSADTTAAATTLVTGDGVVFNPGDIIFIDEDAGGDWNVATEELMVVLADAGANLTVKRGAFGTTAVAYATNTANIYRLSGVVGTYANAGIIGNEITVLETKLGLALKSDSPSGAFTGGTGKYLFGLTATAANNSADSATNTATITYFDVTNNKSAATVANLKAYPAEYDNNSTYATTCVGLSATKWRCTLSTTGSTNQVDENSSRSYTFRGDLGYSGAGSVDFSLASLGTSSTSTNSVYWSDGAATPTTQYWVNQPTTVLQGGSLTTTAASGSADATAPTISSIAITDATADNALTVGATIVITFSEMMDPSTLGSLVPGAAATAVTNGATLDISGVSAASDLIRIMNVIDIDLGNTTAVTGAPTGAVTAALNSAGTAITLTVTTALTLDAAEGTLGLPIAGSAATTMKDLNGTVATAAGSNAATVTAIDL